MKLCINPSNWFNNCFRSVIDTEEGLYRNNYETFFEILNILNSNMDKIFVNFDFMLPRHVHKRVIFFDARCPLGAIFKDYSILRLDPNSPATKARVRPGWILLSVGKQSHAH